MLLPPASIKDNATLLYPTFLYFLTVNSMLRAFGAATNSAFLNRSHYFWREITTVVPSIPKVGLSSRAALVNSNSSRKYVIYSVSGNTKNEAGKLKDEVYPLLSTQ